MRRPGVLSIASAWALLFGALVTGCAGVGDRVVDPSCPTPTISHAAIVANPTNALSAFATANVRDADSIAVRFGVGAAMDSATPPTRVTADTVRAPILGLNATTVYRARLVAFNACGSTLGDVLPFTTAALPSDLPSYNASGTDPTPGFVAFAAGNYGLVIDNTGRVVWYHRFANGAGLNFQAQPNGRFAARPPAPPGEMSNWAEIGADGNVTRTLGCAHGYPPRFHDLIAQPDGSYWIICDETRTVDLSNQGASREAHVLGANVQHLSASGDILFEWSAFDHLEVDIRMLDTPDRVTPIINWTHANALDLDSDGNLLLSLRNLSQVLKIDTHTGALLWRLGGTHSDFTFENTTSAGFVHQHGLRAFGSGIMVLDNLGEPRGSRAERYDLDETRHVARLSGSYGTPSEIVALIGGSAQSFANGHVLVSFGNGDGVEEYSAGGSVIWRLLGDPGYVFRAQRIQSLYQPGVGDPR